MLNWNTPTYHRRRDLWLERKRAKKKRLRTEYPYARLIHYTKEEYRAERRAKNKRARDARRVSAANLKVQRRRFALKGGRTSGR